MFDQPPTLENKLSPLIEGQVPDFIQADHPVYVQFLKSYYKFLESAELKVEVNIDSLLGEEFDPTYIIGETAGLPGKNRPLRLGGRIILEEGSGSTGKFVNNEIITGQTSKATATVHVEDTSNGRIFISANQKFIEGETIIGSTSSAQATIISYRANPVQNIQQLMEYAKPDNTVDFMLENFRRMFMSVIPATLASGVSKRNLIKAIRELYTAKGTSEGHKFFLRLILDDDATITYPEKFMMRVSDGKWTIPKIIRTTLPANVSVDDFIGQKITGETSVASAIIVGATVFLQAGVTFVEYELDPNSITKGLSDFIAGENLTAISKTNNLVYNFTIKNIIVSSSVTSNGMLYSKSEEITTDNSFGNGLVNLNVDNVSVGSIDDVIIDNAGTGYAEGDALVFTADNQANTSSAVGKVSVISGMLRLEDGTAGNSGTDGGQLLIESGEQAVREITNIVLNGSDTSGSNAGDNILLENTSGIGYEADILIAETSLDVFNIVSEAGSGEFVLEPDTTGSLGTNDSDHKGIRKIELINGGAGYSALPIVTVTTSGGSNTKLIATTSNIGGVDDFQIVDSGFEYDTVPEPIFKVHTIVKDISGTFSTGDTLTSHSGTVHSFDSNTQLLSITPSESANSKIILETGNDLIYEDGSKIIREEVFHDGETRTITTATANATIVKVSSAKGLLFNGLVSTKSGSYPFDKLSVLGESKVRIQDSYFYQQFSYEVAVGASLSDYLEELRKAVHPTGFNVFGKVSIATQVSAGISILTGRDIPEYTGDTDTFTPELASMFEIVFPQSLITRRLGTDTDGTSIYAGAGVAKKLDIDDLTTDNDVKFNATKRDLTLKKHMEVDLSTQPINRSNPNALKILNFFPFMENSGKIDLEKFTNEQGFVQSFDDTELIATVAGATSSSTTVVIDAITNNTVPSVDMYVFDNAGISSVVRVTNVTGTTPNLTLTLDTAVSLADDSTIKLHFDFSDNASPPDFSLGPDVNRGTLKLDGDISNFNSVANSIDNVNDNIILEDATDTAAGPNFDQFGSIAFVDFIQYDGIGLEGIDGNAANGQDEAENILLEDNFDLLLEDEEQSNSRDFPLSIWTHPKEKAFALPSVINIK